MKIENSEKLLLTMKTIYYLIVTGSFYDFILQKHLNSHLKKVKDQSAILDVTLFRHSTCYANFPTA